MKTIQHTLAYVLSCKEYNEGQLPATEVAGLSMTGLRLTLALNVLVD